MQSKVRNIDDGRRDLIIGDPDGANVTINEEFLDKHKINYEEFRHSGIEMGKLLMAIGLMVVKLHSSEKTHEQPGSDKRDPEPN